MSYVIITWFSYVMYLQDFKVTYVFGAYILITAPSFVFKTIKSLVPFLFYSEAIMTFSCYMNKDSQFPTGQLFAMVAKFLFIIYLFRNSAIKLQ